MAQERGRKELGQKGVKKAKLTKEERRQKYTAIAKKRREKQRDYRVKSQAVCYRCRQPGHTVAECPSQSEGKGQSPELICYKCGSTEHALSACPKKSETDKELPFATCFLCGEKGHLTSGCPQNKKGVYVNGGKCRRCGSQQHLANACPERKKAKVDVERKDDSAVEELLEADVGQQAKQEALRGKRRRVVQF